MKRSWIYRLSLFLMAALLLAGCAAPAVPAASTETVVPIVLQTETKAPETKAPTEAPTEAATEPETAEPELQISEDGVYTSKEDVAAYLHLFGHLPENFITKKQAQKLGWVSKEGNLWTVAPGKSIGGDYFGNNEGLLPKQPGREYHECDIDFDGGFRNSKRIVFSNDGLVYYTEDHYNTFELLYGEDLL